MTQSHHRHRGFIILFGTQHMVSSDGQMVQAVCPSCHRQTTIRGMVARTWFTLFFCPIFPISGKRGLCQCSACGTRFRMPIQEFGQRLADVEQQQTRQAIAMYNSLRSSPANSVTLNNLLLLYASLKEFDQAVSAAREFSQALNNSEQCMTTLARVLLEQGKTPEALQWFDAALARDPYQGEASYFKAIALMTAPAPDLPGAIAAARVARSANYPGAEALLKELESRSRAA